jgi:cob(I)alamin adenosyltransferase
MKRKPNIVINKVRTGTGDTGTTYLREPRLPKSDALVDFVGDLDEANAALGAAADETHCTTSLQDVLFAIGAGVHTTDAKRFMQIEHRLEDALNAVEQQMVESSAGLAPLEGFIYADSETAPLMLARAVVRRAERSAIKADQQWAVPALNAMSDLLFVLAWQKASSSSMSIPQWTGI